VHLATPWGNVSFRLPIAGRHSASNAAAAIAAAGACGVDIQGAGAAIESAQMSPNRMNVRTTSRGVTLIDDAYNANPKSMAAAFETLAALPAKRRFAFVGVMAELKDPEISHRAIAALARRYDIELISVDTNLYGNESYSLQAAIQRITEFAEGDAVLVKGSRIAGWSSARMLHHHASTSAHAAPRNSNHRAPCASTSGPKIMLPIGTVPPNDMNHNAIVRPRSCGARRPCNTVDIAVVVKKYDTPRKNPVTNAGTADRDAANPNIASAFAAKPQRIMMRGSRPTNKVPSARPPSAAPNAHVA
jgi:hypothetical protein